MNKKVKQTIESEIKQLRVRINSLNEKSKKLDDKTVKLSVEQKRISGCIWDIEVAINHFKKELKELENMWEE